MLASARFDFSSRGLDVKKSVVAVLVLLAVVVLVSPAIVGRMAEKSMGENLNWAVSESGEVRVTSEAFARGWFSSEGQHRVELRDGELLTAIQTLSGPVEASDLPVLVISTHIDHGLIPVTSMSRNKGSLSPGLGSAVSTMRVELPDGEAVDVPGTIYSKLSLGGDLHSNYLLEAGQHAEGGMTATWGPTDINVTTDPVSGEAAFKGAVGPLSVIADNQTMNLAALTFEGQHAPTKFGIAVGNVEFALDDLAIMVDSNQPSGVKAMSVMASTDIDGDDINASATMNMMSQDLPGLGEVAIDMVFDLSGADAAAMGRVQQTLESIGASQDPMAMYSAVEDDLKALFASGFDMNFNQLDVTLPQGTVSSKMLFSFSEEDSATFDWSSLLLGTEASIDLSIPEAVVEMLVQANPEAAMVIGGGYLVLRGDAYEMKAQLKKGLLTVNGAPIPIPLGAVR
jgi:uncharacterized protein YdgA (DUF945 family)